MRRCLRQHLGYRWSLVELCCQSAGQGHLSSHPKERSPAAGVGKCWVTWGSMVGQWRFPKIGVPQKSSILVGCSFINHPAIKGYPHLWKPPYGDCDLAQHQLVFKPLVEHLAQDFARDLLFHLVEQTLSVESRIWQCLEVKNNDV